ncbi:taste receptor type 1 member 1-like [Xyrichtys novacula]|uniref:Taste receptor type 1 member 1-like n=1 Tax=Xyrichtys novacula TaxID=13765 RepID=A0AAV1HI83_XYRNO|nr:taste receptor type 1 member 1-like [Xyrichtys novacula]
MQYASVLKNSTFLSNINLKYTSSKPILLPNYRRFQLMRFSIEQINNSSSLLPDISLGYEMFDHCSDTQNFPGIFNLISVNRLILPWAEPHKQQTNDSDVSKVIAVVGPFTSTQALTVAPFLMTDLIPMVNYGSSSSVFSEKAKFPSFLRTVHPNKDIMEVIVSILLHFNWHWVTFLYSDDDYGNDGVATFRKMIKDTKICLAYSKGVNDNTSYYQIFNQIEALKIHVIVAFAPKLPAEALIMSAIQLNFTQKVWIAGDAWSLNERLPKEEGIQNIGTVLGVSQPVVTIPGFSDFIYSTKCQTSSENLQKPRFCNQVFNCSSYSAEEILSVDPSFSFPVYSAVYAMAHALHNTLQCGDGQCNGNSTVYPHMVLAELKKSNFTLLNQSIEFDEHGDPKYGSYSFVFWNHSGDAEEIGFYKFHPSINFFINDSKIQWFTNGEVPTSLCSKECSEGYVKEQNGIHQCCFTCKICANGTYINSTEDPYKCIRCKETEWSAEGSTSCNLRSVEYIPFTDSGAILIMFGSVALEGLTLAMSALFAINYNTPVVRSAGGLMCFLILGCLTLCSLSVFFYFVCLACFVVRSFQIVSIFKMAAKFPKLYSWWMKYHGQWLIITVAFVSQAFLLLIVYLYSPPKPYNETVWNPKEIILSCESIFLPFSGSAILIVFLGSLCFIFSYMGKDLPKNYNEAKAITFCLLLLILTWIIFATIQVSKPLMEKKRRARINKCLDQLKCLMENYYSSSIRKRKLEKADILELTVKHLRNLQKIQNCTAPSASDFSDYQMGFRSCMANVNQYLMMADNLNGNDNLMLSQLPSRLCRSRPREEVFSTMDSDQGQAEARDEASRFLSSATKPEERKTFTWKALKTHSTSVSPLLPRKDSQQLQATKQANSVQAPKPNLHENSSGNKTCHSTSHTNETANTQGNVWRPW